jgi:hypothetical protein
MKFEHTEEMGYGHRWSIFLEQRSLPASGDSPAPIQGLVLEVDDHGMRVQGFRGVPITPEIAASIKPMIDREAAKYEEALRRQREGK